MKIGVPSEIKNHEYRVALTPAGAHELTEHGHDVLVQSGAGVGSGISDDDYVSAGARIAPDADATWAEAEMIMKVKEPIEPEFHRMREGQTLFTYLHLAADQACTQAILDAGVTAIAYETVQLPDRSLPLLAPMSEVAGRLAVQVGAYHLMKPVGGSGTLLGGVPGTGQSHVVIIGGGIAGEHAAQMAMGLHARVTIMDVNLARLRELDARYQGRLNTLASTKFEIAEQLSTADLVIGSVLIPGAKAPKLVTLDMVAGMKPGSMLVDIAIDQGGCFEGSRATTHADPTFTVHNSVYYCVANMPGAVPHTSTRALTNATLPYAVRLADHGWQEAMLADPALALGLNAHHGTLTNEAVARAWGHTFIETSSVLKH
ncbi:alanine dehydrogenase [Micrococcales bacterium 31B]|nr:alanine dehydrogenase [Micrococcales bacterium 31B]